MNILIIDRVANSINGSPHILTSPLIEKLEKQHKVVLSSSYYSLDDGPDVVLHLPSEKDSINDACLFYAKLTSNKIKRVYDFGSTAKIRKELGLNKTKNKLSKVFDAHCVDSWVLCHIFLGGNLSPVNRDLLILSQIRLHRRQLHAFQPSSGGFRRNYGGTISQGFKRGSLIKHEKYGKCYVGGTMSGKISVHDMETGKRLARNIKSEDCKFFGYNSYKTKINRGESNSASA